MIYPIRSIVAGVADLDETDSVLAPAVELAERTGAVLHLVHAFELPDLMWSAYAGMGYADGEALRRYAQRLQARLEEQVRRLTPSDRVRCVALAGPAAPTIREVAVRERADLLLVGATRRGRLGRVLLGTTAQRVLRSAPAPVLVLHGALPARIGKVLLTTDLSPFSAGIHESSLDVLETLFEGDDAELRSLLVVWYGGELPAPLRADLLEETARGELRTFLGERRTRSRPVAPVVRFGDPAHEIVEEAVQWQPDLVVLGTHGRVGTRRWLLGSVAEAALRSVGASVLVIPAVVEEQRTLPVRREEGAALVRNGAPSFP